MTANDCYDSLGQVDTTLVIVDHFFDKSNLSDVMVQSFQSTIMPYKAYDFIENKSLLMISSHFIINFNNIFPYKLIFMNYKSCFSIFLFLLPISPLINAEIPVCTFVILPSPVKNRTLFLIYI